MCRNTLTKSVLNLSFLVTKAISEYAELKNEFPDRLERLIEEMSRYLAANGRTYQNYAAAMRIWADNDKKDAQKQGVPDYTCKEGESL